MKIAVACEGKTENDMVSPVSGRAPFYLIFEDKKMIEVVPNPFRMGGGGAGVGVAQMLANKDVELVISGKFGPNVQVWLDSKGIKMKIVLDKTVKEAIEEI